MFNEVFILIDGCPTLPTVSYKFESLGNGLISNYAKDSCDEVRFICGGQFDECLESVWSKYKIYSGSDLLRMMNFVDNNVVLVDYNIINNEIEHHETILKKAKEFRNKYKLN